MQCLCLFSYYIETDSVFYFFMQGNRSSVLTGSFHFRIERDFFTIYIDTFSFQSIRQLSGGNGTEDFAAFTNFSWQLKYSITDLIGNSLSIHFQFFSFVSSLTNVLSYNFFVGSVSNYRNALWNEVVTAVTRFYSNNIVFKA